MPWPLKFITIVSVCGHCKAPLTPPAQCECADAARHGHYTAKVDAATGERPAVGSAFYYPEILESGRRADLTARYHAEHAATRPPICVVLPGNSWWVVDTYAHDGSGNHGEGWTVVGSIDTQPPTLTCSPSINCVGSYHGYVQNGVITEDVENRRFSADGSRCQ